MGDLDVPFNFNLDDFKLNMEQFKRDMDVFRDSVKDSVKGGLALQIPRPPSPPGPFLKGAMANPHFNTPADNLYDSAQALINQGRYDRAIDQLNRLVQQFDGKADAIASRVDAALYWKAYIQLKESTFSDALATLADLQKRFADSRWLKDARALELEVRQASGQAVSPDGQTDEELKLLALRGLMRSDPDGALPRLEQIMTGNGSVRLKENALFVLSQSRAPRAKEIVGNVARSNANPDVQLRAVRYLGAMRGTETPQILAEIYRTTPDPTIKRIIIQSYAGSDAADRLSDIARNEKDLPLRRAAIRSLGSMARAKSGDALRSAYLADGSGEVRKDIVNALASQQNAPVLVELARAEKNPELKMEIVSKLSNMKAKEATDYLIDLLK